MTRIDLKILLLRLGMTTTRLARHLGCSRYSITEAFRSDDRPGVMRKIESFYRRHNRQAS